MTGGLSLRKVYRVVRQTASISAWRANAIFFYPIQILWHCTGKSAIPMLRLHGSLIPIVIRFGALLMPA